MSSVRPSPVSRVFRKQRREFEKARHAALSAARKGTEWRKISAWLYSTRDGAFIDVFFIEHMHEEKTSVQVSIKPLELDSLFWRIAGLTDNERRPLSLRANGVFTCSGLRVLEEIIDDEMLDPGESARRLLTLADKGAQTALRKMQSGRFSELLEAHSAAHHQPAATMMGPTYLTALILDERIEEAQRTIQAHTDGNAKSRINFLTHAAGPDDRRDFFSLAAAYLARDR